jgi:hypothetical protein
MSGTTSKLDCVGNVGSAVLVVADNEAECESMNRMVTRILLTRLVRRGKHTWRRICSIWFVR